MIFYQKEFRLSSTRLLLVKIDGNGDSSLANHSAAKTLELRFRWPTRT